MIGEENRLGAAVGLLMKWLERLDYSDPHGDKPEVEAFVRSIHPAECVVLPEETATRGRLRMAMDSREFYELSQAYRHSQEWHGTGGLHVNAVVVAWDALKQYILDNANPPDVEALKDAERLFYVCNGLDGFDGMDFHEEASLQAWGSSNPTKAHYLAAYRKIVDAMILRGSSLPQRSDAPK